MALPELLAALERDLAADLAELEAAGRREADAILAEAHAEADRTQTELAERAAAEAATEAQRIRARARSAADGELRQAAEVAFADLLTAVRQELQRLRRDNAGYSDVLAVLLDEALSVLPAATTVRVDPQDTAGAAAYLEQRGLSVEVVPVLSTWGGAEVDDGKGRVLRNTLEERLNGALPRLRLQFGTALPTLLNSRPGP